MIEEAINGASSSFEKTSATIVPKWKIRFCPRILEANSRHSLLFRLSPPSGPTPKVTQ